MKSKQDNEKNKGQTKRGASSKEAGSQAQEARDSSQGAPPQENVSAKQRDEEVASNAEATAGSGSKAPGEIRGESAQDVVAQFLSKGENNASKYLRILEDLLGNQEGYGWAESTLLGINEFIEKNGYITAKQIEAIENIRNYDNTNNSKKRRTR